MKLEFLLPLWLLLIALFPSCSKGQDEPMFPDDKNSGITGGSNIDNEIAGVDSISLLLPPGFCNGAGYSYDVAKNYCEGMRYQIFDAVYLQHAQKSKNCCYIVDDYYPFMEEEFFQAESETELSSKISAKLSLGLSYNFFHLNGSIGGNLNQTYWDESICVLKRTKRISFVRDIQFRNIVSDALCGDTQLFSDSFRNDWLDIQSMNDDAYVDPTKVREFLNKWGVAFVARSVLGGAIEYELKIDKEKASALANLSLSVDMSLSFLLNAGVNVSYEKSYKEISECSLSKIDIRGGDISRISHIIKGQSITQEDYRAWLESLTIRKDQRANVALVDILLVPISELFSGAAKAEIEQQINL